MEYFETDEATRAHASSAMELMAEHDVPPNPKNFAVWYSYCTRQHPELDRAIDGILEKNEPLTTERSEEIYAAYFSADNTADAIRDASRKIQAALAQILEFVGEAGQETAHYGQVLEDFSGKLSGGPKIEDLRDLVDGVLGETRKMEECSRKVESHLRASTTEVVTLRQRIETVQQEALTDALTGIANRKSFDKSLRDAVREVEEKETQMCLLMTDIDHFKSFNDNWGHQLGDQVLKLVAKTLVECIKGRDIAARYGGEEFAVILPQTRLTHAVTVAENIRAALATKKVVKRATGEELGTITMSVGAALYRPGEPLGQLVQRADSALYLAKQEGRNRVASELDIEDDNPIAQASAHSA